MSRKLHALLPVVVLLVGATVAGAAEPAAKCRAGKLKAMGKYVACRTKAEAKGALQGSPADSSMLLRCANRLLLAWDQQEAIAGGQCDSPPEADAFDAEEVSFRYSSWARAFVEGGNPDICAAGPQ